MVLSTCRTHLTSPGRRLIQASRPTGGRVARSGCGPPYKPIGTNLTGLLASYAGFFAEALELPPEFFDRKIDNHISQLRIMHYPPPEAAPLPGQLRAGAHSDLGMMTLLYSDNDIGGLEVMNRAGRWVPVPVIDDAFTVNLGDLMMRWTNDRWRSTLHRVVNPPAAANDLSRRLSIGMFFIPNYDAVVAPIAGGGDISRYPPITVADYRTSRFASTASHAGAE